jgi:hypothetical protein
MMLSNKASLVEIAWLAYRDPSCKFGGIPYKGIWEFHSLYLCLGKLDFINNQN